MKERERDKEKLFLNLQNIKKIIKSFCPPILWSYLKNLIDKNSKYVSINNLDKKIECYLNFDNGYFVELGANDGISQSNSYYFEKYRGWKGVLVEPIPHNYLKCLKNRSKNTQVFCEWFRSRASVYFKSRILSPFSFPFHPVLCPSFYLSTFLPCPLCPSAVFW